MGNQCGPVNQSLIQKFNSTDRVLVCYQSGQEGHTKPKFPNNPAANANMCCVPRPVHPEQRHVPLHYATVILNSRDERALIDTGSMQSLNSVVKVPIRCIHGDEKCYSTINVHIEVQKQVYLLNVGLVDDLPHSTRFTSVVDCLPGS